MVQYRHGAAYHSRGGSRAELLTLRRTSWNPVLLPTHLDSMLCKALLFQSAQTAARPRCARSDARLCSSRPSCLGAQVQGKRVSAFLGGHDAPQALRQPRPRAAAPRRRGAKGPGVFDAAVSCMHMPACLTLATGTTHL